MTHTEMHRPWPSQRKELDVRLLRDGAFYRQDTAAADSEQKTKMLNCGVSIVLLGSASADFERPEHAPRSLAGAQSGVP